MKRLLTLLLSAVLLTSLSYPVRAAEADDIRCIVVVLAMSEHMDQIEPNGTIIGVMYYMGKLKSENPDADVEALIRSETAALFEQGGDVVESETVRCGEELVAVGEEMEIIGQSLTENPPVE